MGVIIDNRDAVYFSFILKSSVGAVELREALLYHVHGDAQFQRSGHGGQRIGDIMNSGHVEDDPAEIFALMPDLERSASFPVIGNADGAVVFLRAEIPSVISSGRLISPFRTNRPWEGSSAAKRWKELRISARSLKKSIWSSSIFKMIPSVG